MTFPAWVIHYRYFIAVGVVLALAFIVTYLPTYLDPTRPKPEPRHPQHDKDHTEIR